MHNRDIRFLWWKLSVDIWKRCNSWAGVIEWRQKWIFIQVGLGRYSWYGTIAFQPLKFVYQIKQKTDKNFVVI